MTSAAILLLSLVLGPLQQPDGSTALMLAAERNDVKTVEMLIRAGTNVKAANEYGATAVFAAATNGNAGIIRLLLQAKADPNAPLLSGETPLMAAVDKGHVDAVRALLEAGADVNLKESKGGQTALMWAAANKSADIVRLLVDRGADARARSKGGFTPLLFAAQQGDVESGHALLQSGSDANESRTSDRMTALMIAAASGKTDFSVLLLDNGANPDLADQNGYTALHFASSNDTRADIVRALLSRRANPNVRTTRDTRRNTTSGVSNKGATPLFVAASLGNVEVVRALIAGGADPSITTDEKTAPLHVAPWGGDPYIGDWTEEQKKNLFEVTKILVELGADVNTAGEHGWTALHGAAYKGVDAIVQLLIEKGAKTEVFDEYGQTPLSITNAVITPRSKDAYYQSSRVIRKSTSGLLLKLGAKPLAESGVEILDLFYNVTGATQTYPARALTLVAGTSRGGITDVITRVYAEAVSRELGQQVVIDNRPSESGGEAAAYVQTAAPDGYTLLVFSGAQHASLPAIRKVAFEPVKGFAPITTLFTLVNFLAVPRESPANSVAELITLGRRPAGLLFGSSGLGSTSHLTAARLAQSTNTPIKSVHYAGAAPMIADVLSSKLDFTFVSYTVAKPYVLDGRLKLLAVDALERWLDLSTLPTLRQAGINQEKVASWFALAAPAGTPPAVIADLHEAFAKASRDPAVVRAARENGALVTTTSPQELGTMIAREVESASNLVKSLNLSE